MSADAEPLAPPGDSHATRAPGLVWEWTAAALGAVYAVPAALVIFDDLSRGLALSVGVLPAAIVGLAPTRRARRAVVAVRVLSGVPMFIGGALAGVPVIAVAAIALLGIATALLAARSHTGPRRTPRVGAPRRPWCGGLETPSVAGVAKALDPLQDGLAVLVLALVRLDLAQVDL